MSSELEKERLKKLEELKKQGINPYPNFYSKKHSCSHIKEKFKKLKKGEFSKAKVQTGGRIMTLRRMGKATFATIRDQDETIQVYFREDALKKKYSLLKLFDIGDFIGVTGPVFRTQKRELTVKVSKFEMLAKSIKPLPEKYHGLKDTELRYRKRYLDLIMNPGVSETFKIRTKVITAMRQYLDNQGFLEVETPTLQPIYGGANAKPFITHHNSLDMRLYLRISNELYLKRLLVGGFEKVYEFVKDFRNEGIDTSHNPEFTQVEFYEAYGDYNTTMKHFENMISSVAKKVLGTTKIKFQGHNIDLKTPWKRIKMNDALKKYGKIDVTKMSKNQVIKELKKRKIDYEKGLSRGLLVATLFEEVCEKHFIQPTFVIDHPVETTPLCKTMRGGNKDYIERFEPYIAGMEIGNAYTELNDPISQKEYLQEQEERGRAGDDEHHPMDEDFVESIEYGFPPTGGCGIGVDRIIMILTNSPSIRDVIFFPTMKPKE